MRKILTALLAITLTFTLTACGDTNETITENPASVREVLVVGMECNYAPYNWTQFEENEFTVAISGEAGSFVDGYDVQIAKMVATDLDMDLEIVALDWNSLITSLQSGKIDLIIAGMTDTPERRESISFTDAYYESEMVVVTLTDSEFADATSLDDLSGANIVGQMNTIFDEVIDQIPNVNHLNAQTTVPLMVNAVNIGQADGMVVELPAAYGAVASNSNLQIIRFEGDNGFVADTSISIGTRLEDDELEAAINESLATLNTDTRAEIMASAIDRQPSNN